MSNPEIVIAGAGSIGCFVGGLLAAGGCRVTLLARPRIIAEITAHGLTLTDFSGLSAQVSADSLRLSDSPDCLSAAELVLVTVKTSATTEIARLIDRFAPARAPVVSLQNGLHNGETLEEALPGRDVRAGMVPFNVVPMGQGRFHRASSGEILIGTGQEPLALRLSVPGLPVAETASITAFQWGKLLINLNNALNALSGLTIQQQLMDRDWRRLMADQITEALGVLRANGIAAKSTTPVPAGLIPHILRLPTPLFRRIAAQMLTIDPSARTSMSLDLSLRRPTEIDALQGEIIRLGRASGVLTPLTQKVSALLVAAEDAGQGLPNLSVAAIRG